MCAAIRANTPLSRYPRPAQVPVQISALPTADEKYGTTLTPAAPARPAATGFISGKNRALNRNRRR